MLEVLVTIENSPETTPRHYDITIIGTGSGNSVPASDYNNVRIALVEEGRFGGTCLNVGCIPTKMFVLVADVVRNTREASRLGVHGTFDSVDLKQIQDRVFAQRVDQIADSGEAYRRGDETPNIDVYDRRATFTGPRTVCTGVGEETVDITVDNITIAVGSRPQVPGLIAESGVYYYTNENIMCVDKPPREMIVVGGGYIVSEFVHVLASFDTKVHMSVRLDAMLRGSDAAISERFHEVVARDIDVRMNTSIAVLSQEDGIVTTTLDDDTEFAADALPVATGRIPNDDRTSLATSGVEMYDNGRIKVDQYGRTSAEGAWALGDASSPYQPKHIANHEAKVIFHNVLNPSDLREFDHRYIPPVVFSYPQIGQVGMTEGEARAWVAENGTDVTVKVQNYGDAVYGWALEDRDGLAKLIANRATDRLLGAHFIDEQAAILAQRRTQMMSFETDVREVVKGQHWIRPALPELIENATLGLEFDS